MTELERLQQALFNEDGTPRIINIPGEGPTCLPCELQWAPCAYHERERSLSNAQGLFQVMPVSFPRYPKHDRLSPFRYLVARLKGRA